MIARSQTLAVVRGVAGLHKRKDEKQASLESVGSGDDGQWGEGEEVENEIGVIDGAVELCLVVEMDDWLILRGTLISRSLEIAEKAR
jgi:hypothetical protein